LPGTGALELQPSSPSSEQGNGNGATETRAPREPSVAGQERPSEPGWSAVPEGRTSVAPQDSTPPPPPEGKARRSGPGSVAAATSCTGWSAPALSCSYTETGREDRSCILFGTRVCTTLMHAYIFFCERQSMHI
jgi:hypothetical protein